MLDALSGAALGRSHRAKPAKQRIEKATHRLYPGREALIANGKWALTI